MDNDNEITSIFNDYLTNYKSIDIAERAFKQAMAEDADLRAIYREWCHETGSSEKRGFADYCEEYLDRQNEVWDTLNDYDNEE
ncbi:MAG: hypothetical protein NC342_07005 [Pseudoflavonifractor sp.]|nr:hypothetical protein [Alloprevotella sp.]MCM1117266.1 hypothetical protein [Pseudoflavonifractor sp.]